MTRLLLDGTGRPLNIESALQPGLLNIAMATPVGSIAETTLRRPPNTFRGNPPFRNHKHHQRPNKKKIALARTRPQPQHTPSSALPCRRGLTAHEYRPRHGPPHPPLCAKILRAPYASHQTSSAVPANSIPPYYRCKHFTANKSPAIVLSCKPFAINAYDEYPIRAPNHPAPSLSYERKASLPTSRRSWHHDRTCPI